MAPDLATVKSEIKQWERAFRAEHGRDPTVHEMKAAPGMQERYKLYKQLSKSAAQAQPREEVQSQPRNPFSPVKPKVATGAVSSRAYLLLDDARVVPNPFATPPKSKTRPRPKRERSSSPDEPDDLDAFFPPIRSASTAITSDTPTTRARKRLRGEHVPPSPDKPARTRSFARVQSESAPRSLFFTGDGAAAQTRVVNVNGGDEDELGESPQKPAPKDFKPIFDETPPEKKAGAASTLVRSKTMPPGGLFARAPGRTNGNELDHGPTPSSAERKTHNGVPSPPSSKPDKPSKPKPLRRTTTLPAPSASAVAVTAPPNGSKKKKRGLASVVEDTEEDEPSAPAASASTFTTSTTPFAGLGLLPPSPPAAKTTWEPRKGKPKLGAGRSSKKARIEADKDVSESDETETDVFETREIQWRTHGPLQLQIQSQGQRRENGEGDDDLLDEWERDMADGWARPLHLTEEPHVESQVDEPRVKIEVASDMLSVLSLGRSPVRTLRREQDIVRDLLLPTGAARIVGRGADVFAAGDEDEVAEGEDDDWADEGLRWDEADL